MERRGRELDSRKDLVEKTVDIEAKAGLEPTKVGQPSHSHNRCQGPMKDPRMQDTRVEPVKTKSSAPQRSDNAETSKKARKEKSSSVAESTSESLV